MVRAKFKLVRYETQMWSVSQTDPETHKTTYKDEEVRSLIFQPVTSGSEENKAFYASTPGGELKLSIVNKAAWSMFELNREYFLDFTPAG